MDDVDLLVGWRRAHEASAMHDRSGGVELPVVDRSGDHIRDEARHRRARTRSRYSSARQDSAPGSPNPTTCTFVSQENLAQRRLHEIIGAGIALENRRIPHGKEMKYVGALKDLVRRHR